jgi:competence protein ComEA
MHSVGRQQTLLALPKLRNNRRSVDLALAPRGTAKDLQMSTQRILFAALIAAAVSAPAVAEEKKPVSPSTSGPSVNTTRPATSGAATAPVTAKLNLNTATASQLEKLPKITSTEAKAIMNARDKAKFKDWDDFVGRKVISADVAAGIKDSVTF